MTGHTAKIKRTKFLYWMSAPHMTAGQESVLLLHGFGGKYSGLEGLSGLLSQDYNVLGLDLPGYGFSEQLHTKHSLHNYARFLNEFCAKTDFHKVTVVGHSFGADIALIFASMFPERVNKLVLISPVIVHDKHVARYGKVYYKFVAKLPRPLRHKMLHSHIITWLSDTSMFKTATAKQKATILKEDYINDHLMSDRPLIEGYVSMLSTNFMRHARKIKVPTFVLSGSDDTLSPVSDMYELDKAIADSVVNIVEGSGHLLPLEKPRLTYKHIMQYLKQGM